jgi:hypothetical protein
MSYFYTEGDRSKPGGSVYLLLTAFDIGVPPLKRDLSEPLRTKIGCDPFAQGRHPPKFARIKLLLTYRLERVISLLIPYHFSGLAPLLCYQRLRLTH